MRPRNVALAALVVACASAALVVAARSTARARHVRRSPARRRHARPRGTRRPAAREPVGARGDTDRRMVDGQRSARVEHALLGNRAQDRARRARRRRPDRRRVQQRPRLRRARRWAKRSGALHLRVRGRCCARVDADRADRLVDARGAGVPRRAGGALPRARAARLAAVRHGLPQRHASSCSTRGGGRSRLARGAFADPAIPAWYAPFGIAAIGGTRLRHVRVARAGERQRRADRRLRRRVHAGRAARRAPAARAVERAVGARACAEERSAASAATCSSATSATARSAHTAGPTGRWVFDGYLQDRNHRPIAISGLWSLAFGNDGLAGSSHTLFFTAGPHTWRRRDRAVGARAARRDRTGLSGHLERDLPKSGPPD